MNTLQKLTVKNLRLNKSRTIVTIMGILLSCALITVVINVGFSFQQTILQEEKLISGDYIYSSNCATTEDISKLKANRNVSDVYVKRFVGVGELPDPKFVNKPNIIVNAMNKSGFEKGFSCSLASGRLPQNSRELVLAENVNSNSKVKYKVGDVVNLNLGFKYTKENGKMIPLPPDNGYNENIVFKNKKSYSYKIVGIMENNHCSIIQGENYCDFCNAFTLYEGEEITDKESHYSYVYVNFIEEEMKNYLQIVGDIMGVSPETVRGCLVEEEPDESQIEEMEGHLKQEQSPKINTSLLSKRGIDLSDNTTMVILVIALVVIFITMISSILVIRNSFAISITEKTKLYGMLSSVGATSKQIRRNVLFEGLILGIIGIPLGIGLGYSVTGGLIALLNVLLKEALNGFVIHFGTSLWVPVIAVVLSSITIFLSCFFTAVRASKIPPVSAIRSNEDIKSDNKNYKTPKYIARLFGVGGEIAYKSLKRSRKKYRTTIISIVASVVLFITMSAFMDYTFGFLMNGEISIPEYNISYNTSSKTYKEAIKEYNLFKTFDEVEDSYINSYEYVNLVYEDSWIKSGISDSGDNIVDMNIVGVDKEDFTLIAEQCGYSYEQAKNLAFYYHYMDEDNNITFDFPKNTELKTYYDITYDNGVIEEQSALAYKIKIGGNLTEYPKEIKTKYNYDCFIVPLEWMTEQGKVGTLFANFKTDSPDKLEEEITKYDNSLYVENTDKQVRMMKSIYLVIAIFVYGFIIVISLIGITNIFNTITTNMKLRQKEFAMLRSVGMTNKEFRRMVSLESFMYGMKSLLIGIPLGILFNFLIYYGFSYGNTNLVFSFPFLSVILSVIFVFLLVWVIMMFSISKTKKQNIIETIRNDNI